MKPERGQYRSITAVLLDGPDFQGLAPEARWVFVALKISLGPCGIEVEYPEALLVKLAARTGFPPTLVAAKLDELEAAGWVRRERNVVWIVKQLEFEPAMTSKNEKHRAAVLAHAKGLPRLAIVGAFIRQYHDYIADAEALAKTYPRYQDRPSKGHRKGIDSLSNHRDKTETETETEISAPEQPARSTDTWLTPFWNAWVESRGGDPSGGRLAKEFAVLRKAHGDHQVLVTWVGYLEERKDKGFCTVEDFRQNYGIYRRKWAVEIGEDGTERPMPDEPMVAA